MLYFIIKKVKSYKMMFVVVSLTPTVIQFATSLSYDCFNYVAFAWLTATLINIGMEIREKKEPSIPQFIARIVLPSFAVVVSKINSILLIGLVILVFLVLVGQKLKVKLSKRQILSSLAVLFVLGLGIFLLKYHSHLHLAASKLFYTFLEPYYTVLTTEVIGGTNTNGLPAWLFVLQVISLALLFLSYEKETVPRWFAWTGFALVLVNLFGLLFSYGINPSFANNRTITGPQGRYFTPFVLLFAPLGTLLAKKLKLVIQNKKGLYRGVLLVSTLALVLSLTILSVKFYRLQLPADVYRSGVEHYIFK
jgi:uncharacterized membrane protein